MKHERQHRERKEPEIEPVSPGSEPSEDVCSRKVYDELYDRHLRLQAEFDNFRKRSEKEKRAFRVHANEQLITDLLPILDHLELAVAHARESSSNGPLLEGVQLVLNQFLSVLEKYGVTAIEASGKHFDPQIHEAVAQVESNERDENTVMHEIRRGYLIAGRTLRPSRVTVTRKPDTPTGEADSGQ